MARVLHIGILSCLSLACFAAPDDGSAGGAVVDPSPSPTAVDPKPADTSLVAPTPVAVVPEASNIPAAAIADATATAADIAAPAAAAVAEPIAPIAAEDVTEEIDAMIEMAGKSHVASFSASIVLDTGVYVTISAARSVTPKSA